MNSREYAAAFESVKVSAGVLVAVATEAVNRGERLPAEKDVTVPLPPPPENVQVVLVQDTPEPVNVNAPVVELIEETPPPLLPTHDPHALVP